MRRLSVLGKGEDGEGGDEGQDAGQDRPMLWGTATWVKKHTILCLAIIWAKSDFQYSSTVGINNKFVIRLLLYFLPHFKCVYTSPCKMQKINMQHVRGLSAVNDGDEKK